MTKITQFLFILSVLIYMGCNTTQKTSTDAKASTSTMTKATPMTTSGKLSFTAANDRYNAEGEFKKWYFEKVNINKKDIESLTATIAIDMASVSEKSDGLTQHLKADDFFDVEKFSAATIDITKVSKNADGTYMADMKLNMKGLSQDIKSNFEVTSMNPIHVKGTAKVNRNLFSIGSAKMSVPEMVEVTYDTDLPN